MLSLGKERLSGRVSVEDIPSGHKHLTSILDAMTESHEIRIGYQKYTSAKADSYTLRPYAVKEYAKRWYLVAYCLEREAMRVYGLDRITHMEITEAIFDMPKDFDVDALFATSFGIYMTEGKGQTITFRTSRTEAKYFRDLPVHKSQKEESSDDESVTFSIFVCPDKNLIMEFCKYASRVEVLSPEHIREEVAAELKAAAATYDHL